VRSTPAGVLQDEQLRSAVNLNGGRNWKAIAKSAFGNTKTDVQCLHRSVHQPPLLAERAHRTQRKYSLMLSTECAWN